MGKITSEDAGKFYHHYPRVAAVVTAQAKEKRAAMGKVKGGL